MTMNVFISVVSHGHHEVIKHLKCLEKLAIKHHVVIKSNKHENLVSYCKSHGIYHIDCAYGLGFGANNNVVFEYCRNKLGMKQHDFFIVINPDIFISLEMLDNLLMSMTENGHCLAAINLFRDKNFTINDNSVRNFPTFLNFVKSFLGFQKSYVIEKNKIRNIIPVDWAAGSFMAFKVEHYQLLRGFDESYFMYCEDVDLCYRSNKLGYPIFYYPEIKALHAAKHENRKIFSIHFLWHVRSVLRFLLSKIGLKRSTTRI